MKILLLSTNFPYPPTKGRKQLRTFKLLQYLASRHQVTLVTQRNQEITEEQIGIIQEPLAELKIFPTQLADKSTGAKAKRIGTFLQQGTLPDILENYSPVIATWVKQAIAEEQFDAIACEESTDEIYLELQWREKLGTVLDLHSSNYGRYKQQLEIGDSDNELKDQINLRLQKRYEQNYLDKFSHIVTVTAKDRRIIKELSPESSVIIIPNGVDLQEFPRRVTNQGGQRIVFVGNMDRAVNIDGAKFLAQEVFVEIRKRYPEAVLELVGAQPTEEVLQLAELPGVKVTGAVSSVIEYLHWATVCVIPIRKGFGLRNRTLEAMAAGVPVVATDRALEGLNVDGASIPLRAMRANTIEEYVYAIGRLFSEPKLRDKLSENGRLFVENEYTWEQVGQKYEQVLLDSVNLSSG